MSWSLILFVQKITFLNCCIKNTRSHILDEKEGTFVRVLLEKYFSRGHIIELMYLSKSGEISKRRVKIIKIQGDSFQAYCFTRSAKRTFLIDNVLACVPIVSRERDVI